MRLFPIFLSVAAIIAGLVIFAGLVSGSIEGYYMSTWIDATIAIVLVAGGLTYLWKLTGFRGLLSK